MKINIFLIVLLLLLAGCDPGTWTYVYLHGETMNNTHSRTRLTETELNKAIVIVDTVGKIYELEVGRAHDRKNVFEFEYFKSQDGSSAGFSLKAEVIDEGKTVKVHTIDWPSVVHSDLALNIQTQLIELFSSEFGPERVRFDRTP